MNVLDGVIPVAQAQVQAPASQAPAAGGMQMFFPLLIVFALMYFFVLRPQQKRQKEHRAMVTQLKKGDEVITSSGIAGWVREIGDSFLLLEVAENVHIRVQKSAVGQVLPVGTLKST